MSKKSDFFFLHLKQLYPHFARPSAIDEEIWEDTLAPFCIEDIYKALKNYRQDKNGGSIPTPCVFKEFLYPYVPLKLDNSLPLSPETVLMEEDIKAGRCKHLFPDYVKGVEYVLYHKLQEYVDKEELDTYSRGRRYYKAVEYGLFGEFDDVLEIVHPKGAII